MRHVKRYKELFEAQNELSQEQTEWLDKCTSKSWTRGSWTLNPQTGLVDVSGDFSCSSQGLSDFKGVRFGVVSGSFYCTGNKLTSLKGAPQEVGGNFNCYVNPVSDSVLEALYKKMQSGMSWPDAVAEEWDSIESEEDKILLAPHNLNLSPEELKGYQALARLRKRIL